LKQGIMQTTLESLMAPLIVRAGEDPALVVFGL